MTTNSFVDIVFQGISAQEIDELLSPFEESLSNTSRHLHEVNVDNFISDQKKKTRKAVQNAMSVMSNGGCFTIKRNQNP